MKINRVEVGVITAHPLHMAYKSVLSIIRTWRYAKRLGIPANKWYGVYESESEIVLAQMGCLPGAETRACHLANAINKPSNHH